DAGVAQLLKVSDRVEAGCRTGIAGNENQIALFGARGRPLKITSGLNRLIVFIDPHQRHINIEAWKVEVVGISAKESGLKLEHKNQTNVGVFLITIKIVLSALVKRDD